MRLGFSYLIVRLPPVVNPAPRTRWWSRRPGRPGEISPDERVISNTPEALRDAPRPARRSLPLRGLATRGPAGCGTHRVLTSLGVIVLSRVRGRPGRPLSPSASKVGGGRKGHAPEGGHPGPEEGPTAAPDARSTGRPVDRGLQQSVGGRLAGADDRRHGTRVGHPPSSAATPRPGPSDRPRTRAERLRPLLGAVRLRRTAQPSRDGRGDPRGSRHGQPR